MKKLKKKKFKEREGENLNRDLFKTGNFCTDLLRNLFFRHRRHALYLYKRAHINTRRLGHMLHKMKFCYT